MMHYRASNELRKESNEHGIIQEIPFLYFSAVGINKESNLLKSIKTNPDGKLKVLIVEICVKQLVQVPQYKIVILEIAQENHIHYDSSDQPKQPLSLNFSLVPAQNQEAEKVIEEE
jgi:hypothetical protein